MKEKKTSWCNPAPTFQPPVDAPPVAADVPRKPRDRKAARGRLPDGAANPVDVHVGARVRQRRTLLGMSQEKLSDALGLTFQQVQKYERGANRIGASRLYDISRVLDVPVSYFYEDMPASVVACAPSAVIAGTAVAPATHDASPLDRRETLELVRAYYRIADPAIRERIVMLAKSLGNAPDVEPDVVESGEC